MDILEGFNQTLFPGYRVIRVNGWQAGEKYPMPRDCEAIMLDSDPTVDYIYMKRVDQNGAETFARYKIEEDPIPRFDPEKYVTKKDFSKFQEEILNGFDSLKQSINNAGFNNTKSGNGNKQSNKSNSEFSQSTTNV